MKENFPNLAKEIDTQIQEAQKVPNKLDPKKYTPRQIIIKMPKVSLYFQELFLQFVIMPKVKIKRETEKQRVTQKGVPIRLSAGFSKEALQARWDWQEVFKVMESKDLQPRFLYPAKLSFRMEGQIKCFPDKVKAKGFHHHQAIM